ncbi:MAG: hypothetical protein AAFX93_00395 [Verrucomicrobiota bacterium]
MIRAGIFFFISLFGVFTHVIAKDSATTSTDTLPLSEIKPGMQGTWRTVVEGSKIEEYRFEVIGVSPNFVGPRAPVIIAKALDDSQILSGPVAGMSGSPCYIGDKMIGAYAYGFTWPKEQAIIGITPIDEMLAVFEKGRPGNNSTAGEASRKSGPVMIRRLPGPAKRLGFPTISRSLEKPDTPIELETTSTQVGELANFSSPENMAAVLSPLPTPLMVGGLSGKAADFFSPYAREMGFELMSSPVGSADHLTGDDLIPGAPVAGILLGGDFPISAVGTCTWREDDDLLAFGHPFLQGGPVDIPIAPAEIMAVVQTYPSSFKLANTGKPVGSIYQDRLTAVAGEIGRMASVTNYQVNVTDPSDTTRSYQGDLFQNELISPMIAAIGLMMSTTATLEVEDEQSYGVEVIAEYDGHEPVTWQQFGSGSLGLSSITFGVWDMLGTIAENPFEKANLAKLTINITISTGRDNIAMDRIQLLSGQPKPGDSVEVSIGLRNFRDESKRTRVSAIIPEGTSGENLYLFVGDSRAADRIDDGYSRSVASLDELLDYYRTRRDNERIYVKLLRRTTGLRTNDQSLYELPPSAMKLIQSSRTIEPHTSLREITLWETSIETDGSFTGSHRFTIPIAKR